MTKQLISVSRETMKKIIDLRHQGKTFIEIGQELGMTGDKVNALYRRHGRTQLPPTKKTFEYEDLIPENVNKQRQVSFASRRRFVVFAVQVGAKVHSEHLATIETFCQARGADLVLLPMRSHVAPLQDQPQHFDPILRPYLNRFYQELGLNPRLKALELQLNPQQINPLTGLTRIRGRAGVQDALNYQDIIKPRNQSIVVAHSKQMMKQFATGNNTPRKMIHSTGSLTLPNYLMDTRIGLIANEDHTMGGLVVEVEDDTFHIRQLQFSLLNSSVVDFTLNGVVRYHPDGKLTTERLSGLVGGDLHPGHESAEALETFRMECELGRPRQIFLHDWIDGSHVNRHVRDRHLARNLQDTFKSLREELEYTQHVIYEKIAKFAPSDCEIIMVPSNHTDFITSYLDSGDYVRDSIRDNYRLGHEMIVDKLNGIDPIATRIDPKGRLRFPSPNEDIFCEGVQCNVHGHKGPNGAKGSPANLEGAYSAAMTGHTHTAEITHELYVVGHMSNPRHGYNNGASSWSITNGHIYTGGQRQLISTINGKFTIDQE